MVNLSTALILAQNALAAQQAAIQTAGHNIANANTPGFTRQRVDLASSLSVQSPLIGTLGTGVDMQRVSRFRDLLLDSQFREANQTLGQAQAEEAVLSQVESLIGEPSPGSLSAAMAAFFASFEDLANHPTDLGVRTVVRDKAVTLTSLLHRLSGGLDNLKADLNTQIRQAVGDVNRLAQQITGLNATIAAAEAGGGSANDLRDQRDKALDDLSKLVGASSLEAGDGQVRVTIGGGVTLVDGQTSAPIVFALDSGTDSVNLSVSGVALTPRGGTLLGLLNARNSSTGFIKGAQAQLDALANGLALQVNAVHATGFALDTITTGLAFFTGTTAATIDVNPTIQTDVSLIAAASTTNPGDNGNALALAQLQNSPIASLSNSTFSGFLSSVIADLGAQAASAKQSLSLGSSTTDFLTNRREQVSGVSLDEEMTDLIRFQRAYEAAAHFTSVVNDLLGSLIQQLGR